MTGSVLTDRIVRESEVILPTPVEACASWMADRRVRASVLAAEFSTSFVSHRPSPSLTSSASPSESTTNDLLVWLDGWRCKDDAGCSSEWSRLIYSLQALTVHSATPRMRAIRNAAAVIPCMISLAISIVYLCLSARWAGM